MALEKLGKYKILESLGEGATAHVYLARDTQLLRDVALKVLKPALVSDPGAFERFVQEARAAANLFHAHIATVLDMGEADGRYYIAMRYLSGYSLDVILKNETLSWDETQKLVQQIGAALEFAHQQGFLHRDIKPSNIIRDEQGNFWLTDFGLTKAMMSTGLTSHTGAVLGTPPYIAPEIWQGQDAQPGTDLYALACVVCEALTGEILFQGDTPPATMKRHFDPPQLPQTWQKGVPSGIDLVLQTALAQEPEKRYAGPAAFTEAVLELEDGGEIDRHPPTELIPPSETDIQRPETRKPDAPLWQRWPLWAVAGALVLAVIYVLSRPQESIPVGETVVVNSQTPSQASTDSPETPSPAPIQPVIIETRVSDIDGMVQVLIPAGEFQMGSEDGSSDESPLHTVYLDAFWIDQTEVTNAMYVAFMNQRGNQSAGGVTWLDDTDLNVLIERVDGVWRPKSGYEDHPVIEVSGYGAQAYCEWAERRLPTEAEWEKAARGGLEGAKYSWGDEDPVCTPDAQNGARSKGCPDFTVAVGAYGFNGYGLYDMAGNVWEWVSDWYAENYYQQSPASNPPGSADGEFRILRGGSWDDGGEDLRVSIRNWHDPTVSTDKIGFRCAYGDAASPETGGDAQAVDSSQTETVDASLELGSSQVSEIDGMVQIYIPAGEFGMGTNSGPGDERPLHTVYLDAMWVDQTEVTNAQYLLCVQAGICAAPEEESSNSREFYYRNPTYADYPMINISWDDAVNYCSWAGRRLLTEAEWEKAARGGLESKSYPRGDTSPVCHYKGGNGANFNDGIDCDYADTEFVGSYLPNGYGLFDMAGNVWEWVADWYERYYYENSPSSNPQGPDTGNHRVLRGGSWSREEKYLQVTSRFGNSPQLSGFDIGFRCAMDAEQ
jgi:eukaryotic-like serine/threonine-protein kinase